MWFLRAWVTSTNGTSLRFRDRSDGAREQLMSWRFCSGASSTIFFFGCEAETVVRYDAVDSTEDKGIAQFAVMTWQAI